MKETTKKILHCAVLLFIALLQIFLNYWYYRFAYQIATVYTIIIVCAIMQLFAKTRKNAIYLYILAFVMLFISIFYMPQYTIYSAKEKILKNSTDISDVSFSGIAISPVDKSKTIFNYKNYLFEIDNITDKIIIFDINTGQFFLED
jgi:hypothetical protein